LGDVAIKGKSVKNDKTPTTRASIFKGRSVTSFDDAKNRQKKSIILQGKLPRFYIELDDDDEEEEGGAGGGKLEGKLEDVDL
jgi:hypothetical protein